MIQMLNFDQIRKIMEEHAVKVFETMLSMKSSPCAECTFANASERVSSSVGFAGDNVIGVVYLHVSGQFAIRIAAAIFGLASDAVPAQVEANDIVGELGNILAGGLKSHLCDLGFSCAVSTPTIIRGTSFAIESVQGVERMFLAFQVDGDCFMIEIHLKTQ